MATLRAPPLRSREPASLLPPPSTSQYASLRDGPGAGGRGGAGQAVARVRSPMGSLAAHDLCSNRTNRGAPSVHLLMRFCSA
jgi:hypothetical protein